MGSQPRRLAILRLVVSMLAIGLECDASAEQCDYKTCGALMARDASASWAVSGRHDYSPDTKRACAEFNACVRRAKNNSAGRAAATPTAGSSSIEIEGPATQRAAPVTVGSSPATIGSTLRASCGPDMQSLCAGARRENEVLKCLDSQRMELSTTCSLYFRKLGARPTAQGNASNKKPPSPPPTMQIPVQKKKPLSPLPTMPIPVQENAPNEQPLSPPPASPIPPQENAPKEKPPSLPPSTPIPVQENAPNKKPPPPTTPIPD
jgi:hypothetical protein